MVRAPVFDFIIDDALLARHEDHCAGCDARKMDELINDMIRRLIEFRIDTPQAAHKRSGRANVKIRKAVTKAARERDAEKVRALRVIHVTEAPR